MKYAIAIVLLCLPAQVSAAERCSMSRVNRDEVARVVSAKPVVIRAEVGRTQKVRPPAAWQRLQLFEQQIL